MAPGLSLVLVLCSLTPEGTASVRAETSFGTLPPAPGEPQARALDLSLAPTLGLNLVGDAFVARFGYGLSILERIPTITDRPIFFHRFTSDVTHKVSRVFDWTAGANAGFGERDFANASFQLNADDNAPPGALPDNRVIRLVTAAGSLGARRIITRRWSLGATGRVGYTGPFGETMLIRPQITGRLATDLGFRATRVDSFQLTLAGQAQRLDTITTAPSVRNYVAESTLAYRRRLSDAWDGRIGAGIALLGDPNEVNVGPRAELGLIYGSIRGEWILRGSLDSGIQTFVDPILGIIEPRAFASVSAGGERARELFVTARASVFVPTTSQPPQVGGVLVPYRGTVVSFDTPVVYRASREVSLETGARFSARGPHPSTPDFRFEEIFVQAYVALILAVTTERSPF